MRSLFGILVLSAAFLFVGFQGGLLYSDHDATRVRRTFKILDRCTRVSRRSISIMTGVHQVQHDFIGAPDFPTVFASAGVRSVDSTRSAADDD